MALHITSDGDAKSASIVDESGRKIEGVTEATLFIEAGNFNRIDLTFGLPSVDVKAYVHQVTMVCPCCNDTMTHRCQGAP